MTTLARLAGQLLSVGFDGTGRGRRAARAHRRLGGRRRDAVSAEHRQTRGSWRRWWRTLRGAAPGDRPLLVSIDQEGGLVQRLRAPATVWPPMLSVGRGGRRRAHAAAVGRALGEELAAVGVGWNFAPVLDVHTNPDNPVIGNRAFGTTPEAVARQALAFWRGLRAAGLVGCGKHYPGHGDTRTDSHHELPVVAHDVDRLRAVELAPFAAAAARRPGGVHDRARALSGAGPRSAGDAVAPDRDRPAARRARLSRRAGVRRPRHEGGRRSLPDRGAGGGRDRGGRRSPAGARAGRAPASRRSRRSSTPPRRAATCGRASRRARRASPR